MKLSKKEQTEDLNVTIGRIVGVAKNTNNERLLLLINKLSKDLENYTMKTTIDDSIDDCSACNEIQNVTGHLCPLHTSWLDDPDNMNELFIEQEMNDKDIDPFLCDAQNDRYYDR